MDRSLKRERERGEREREGERERKRCEGCEFTCEAGIGGKGLREAHGRVEFMAGYGDDAGGV